MFSKRLLIGLFLSFNTSAFAADSTVSALTAASALGGTELFYCVQGGADRKCTSTQLGTYILTTPNIGVATGTSLNLSGALLALTFNGNTITSGTGTLTLGSVTLNAGSGGTLGSNAFTSTAFAPLASPTFTGTVVIPTPFTLGTISVTSTGTQLNYLNAATGTTGTTSTNVVFSTNPVLITPNLGTPSTLVLTNATGTPSTITLTNGTGLPTTGLTGTLQAAQEPAHTGDVTNSAGSLALTIAANAVSFAKMATQATNTIVGNATSGTAVPTALAIGTCSTAASAVIWTTNTGFGCNTSITANAVAVGGITGLGTGVATALAVNVGSAGAFVTFNGAGGTPSSMTATNLSGTAASLTAGNVTTNANLTGAITSVGNATTMNSASTALTDVTAATTWTVSDQSGAALTLSTVTGNFSKGNKTCIGTVRYTMPTTADTNAAKISLPCTVANNGSPAIGACWTTAATAANSHLILLGAANAATSTFINTTGGGTSPQNVALTGLIVSCNFAFITT